MSQRLILPELKREKKKSPLSRQDQLISIAFRLFARPASFLAQSLPLLREQILKSNMRVTAEGLISLGLLFTVVAGGIVAALVYLGAVIYGVIYFLALPVVVPIVFIIIINGPKFSATSRAAAVDTELPFVVGYMSVLAGGGVSPMATLRRIAKMKLFPASSKEAKRVLLETDVFGQDPITAMENVARTNPSRKLSEFFFGYTAVLKSGGDFMAYIQLKLKDIIESKSAQVKRASDSTGTMAEAYLTVTVILGMTLYTLFMIQTLISGNTGALQNLYLFAFLVVPLLSFGFMYLIDAVQPKWPYTDFRPYRYLVLTAPMAAAVFLVSTFLVPFYVGLYWRVSLTLIALASLPAFFAMKYSKERRSLERALPDFIRDVSEGRKTGLSPEKSIERLTDRHYGVLSKFVKRMGAQLSWGVSLAKVISTFTSDVGSWITRATGTLLIEVVDVGGGTMRSFSDMAEFTRAINDMENERRAALRPFVFITYVAGIMVVFTTFIMVYLLGQPAARGFSSVATIDGATIDLLLVTSIFDTFVIGIVAGKMGESSVSDGFKHAIALTAVSLVAVQIAKLFIPIPV